ncbi:MAG: hypothetical protein AAFR11_09335 [Pseudomonadota bacterium]
MPEIDVKNLANEVFDIVQRIEALQQDCMSVNDSERALALHAIVDRLLAVIDRPATVATHPISDDTKPLAN